MKPLAETERHAHAVVEAALQAYPRVQAPSRFADRVMARIRARTGYAVAPPRFQFPWLELLIGVISLFMMAIVWQVWRRMPPVYLEQLRLLGWSLWRQLEWLGRGQMFEWLVPLAVLIAAVFLGGAAVVFTSRREWQS